MLGSERTASSVDDYLFDLRGYLVLERAVESELVSELNAVLSAFPPLEYGQWHGNVQRLDNNGAAGAELQNIVEAGEPFERLIDHPSWVELVRHFAGEEASPTWSGLFIDECFASIRRSGGFFQIHSGGHQASIRGQYRYVDGVFRCGQVNILLALTDVGPGDGGTMVVPGSHKSHLPHPQRRKDRSEPRRRMDDAVGAIEVHLRAGDALLFCDGLAHGASSRTNPGERRVVIYRYGPRWGSTRHGYRYSEELLSRLTPERRAILQPVPPRIPGSPAQLTPSPSAG